MFNFEKQENYFSSHLHFAFSGRMDTDACTQDSKEVEEHLKDQTQPVVFDLKTVEYVSSAFLRICVKVAKTVGNEKFSIINVPPQIMKVFKIAGFDTMLNIK